jgi:hypothetical protein
MIDGKSAGRMQSVAHTRGERHGLPHSKCVLDHLTFTEFVDFVLVRLNELDAQEGAYGFHDVRAIAGELKEPVPEYWPAQAVGVLQDAGSSRVTALSAAKRAGR